jgi:metal-responsive CopG/Arc/MetJ family transcriptional regulator
MSVEVTLPDELVAKIDTVTTDRAAFIETAVRRMLRDSASGMDEIEKINAVADELNAEAEDVLEYQVIA